MTIYAVQMTRLLCELPFITSDVSRNFNHDLFTLTVLLIVMPYLRYTIAAITYFLSIFKIFHLNCGRPSKTLPHRVECLDIINYSSVLKREI